MNQNDIQPTLIFIPDISGFTSFINEIEVEHSTHIITELLEIIIESNILKLKVSEIEGDAVLFYRIGDEPSFIEIAKQAEVMFLEFHRHLKYYDRDRICQCGACSTTHKLSLKFVYHFGRTTLRKIKKHEKLFGPDVTLAHRLLKNNIQEDEYLLLTSLPHYSDELKMPDWMLLKQGKNDYEGIGEVDYNYLSLASLKSKVSELAERNIIKKYRNSVSVSVTIKASLEKVHGIVTNVSLKPKWVLGLRSVQEQGNQLSRVGSKHLCVMPTTIIDFEITSQNIKKGIIEYVEKSDNIKWVSPLYVLFTMKRISRNKTQIEVNIHYKKNILSKLYLDFPLRLMIIVIAQISLLKLKKYIT